MDGTTIKDGQSVWFSNYDMAMTFMHQQMDINDIVSLNFLHHDNRYQYNGDKWISGEYLVSEAGGNGHDVLIELEHI